MIVGILGFGIILAIVALFAWVIVGEAIIAYRRATEIPNCYAGKPCGTCRSCQMESDQEYTIPTIKAYAIDSIPSVATNNYRIGKAI